MFSLSGLVSRFAMSFVKMFWQSHTDRELGKAKAHNENLEKSNEELDRHAEIDSNDVSTDDAYAGLGLSDGDVDRHSNSVPKVSESKSGSVVNIKSFGKLSD